jgi:predicted RNA binding protein YcfA (HicA-like mRNA interferase family)
VGKAAKTLEQILRGTADANVRFDDLCNLLHRLGFDERISGSHHIFTRQDVHEILNLQPRNKQAKPYQVKQVRGVIITYRLADQLEE